MNIHERVDLLWENYWLLVQLELVDTLQWFESGMVFVPIGSKVKSLGDLSEARGG